MTNAERGRVRGALAALIITLGTVAVLGIMGCTKKEEPTETKVEAESRPKPRFEGYALPGGGDYYATISGFLIVDNEGEGGRHEYLFNRNGGILQIK